MDWTTLLAIGVFAVVWLATIFQSQKDDWETGRTAGMVVFLTGATCGVFLDDVLSAGSSVLPWRELIAAVIMLVGVFILRTWEHE